MPFGPYDSFDECVARNQDKSSPEGFCAWLEHETTGQWPGEMSLLEGMSEELRKLFLDRFGSEMKSGKGEVVALSIAHKSITDAGWVQKNSQWIKGYQAMLSRTIRNVEIFAAGEHNGDVYNQEDLDGIIEAFYALRGRIDPPLKLGHSSDQFNKEIARRMGLPGGVVTGDKGEGALAFGWVDNLRRYDDILVADFVKVPEAIATLIESQLYRHVSCEINVQYDDGGKVWPYILSGVALLGAEMPAVNEIHGLDKVMVYAVTTPSKARSYTFEKKGEYMAKGIKAEDKGFWSEVIKRLKEVFGFDESEMEKNEEGAEILRNAPILGRIEIKEADMLKEINKVLGLAEDATVEDAMAEIAKLKANPEAKKFTDLEAQIRIFKGRAETAEAQIKAQDRAARIVKYTVLAGEWKAIAGKPEEIAERIVNLENNDPKLAEDLVATYAALNQSAVVAGIIKPLGTSAPGEVGRTAFELKVEQLENERNDGGLLRYKSHAEAVRAASERFPELFREERNRQSK